MISRKVVNLNLYYHIEIETNTFQGGCCFAFKMEHIDEQTGDVTYESRHGASTSPDQPWFDQECGKTVIMLI